MYICHYSFINKKEEISTYDWQIDLRMFSDLNNSIEARREKVKKFSKLCYLSYRRRFEDKQWLIIVALTFMIPW